MKNKFRKKWRGCTKYYFLNANCAYLSSICGFRKIIADKCKATEVVLIHIPSLISMQRLKSHFYKVSPKVGAPLSRNWRGAIKIVYYVQMNDFPSTDWNSKMLLCFGVYWTDIFSALIGFCGYSFCKLSLQKLRCLLTEWSFCFYARFSSGKTEAFISCR